jgi:2-dehydropantoate 2-reductase
MIHHFGEGRILLGEFQRWPEPRTHDIASMFQHAGVVCKVTDNLARGHWEKLVWNIPFNGLGVAGAAGYDALANQSAAISRPLGPCVTSDKLLDRGQWELLVRDLMSETMAAAKALGHAIDPSLPDKLVERTRPLGAYKASTLLDFECGRPLELESLFLEPLRQAQRAGVATPRLAALCEVLCRLESRSRT